MEWCSTQMKARVYGPLEKKMREAAYLGLRVEGPKNAFNTKKVV